MVQVEMLVHWSEHDASPGDKIELAEDVARRAVQNGSAVFVSKREAKAAGEPEGRTVADARTEEPS